MAMQTEALVVLSLCGVVLLLIAIGSWYRRKKQGKEMSSISRIQETVVNGQRTFRIATVSRHAGQLSLDIYEIRLPRPNEPASAATIRLLPSPTGINSQTQPPPPPFSTAINMPSPEEEEEEEGPVPPPPTYEEIIPSSSVSKVKSPEGQDENENSSTKSTTAQTAS